MRSIVSITNDGFSQGNMMNGSLSHGDSRTIDKENTRLIGAFLHKELIISKQLKKTQSLQYTIR